MRTPAILPAIMVDETRISEKSKMLAGELYNASDPQLLDERRRARELLAAFNGSLPDAGPARKKILTDLLGSLGKGVYIEPPFYCDYGWNIHLSEKVYFNFNCIILDVCEVRIGPRTLVGPAVQIYAATHPLDASLRAMELECGRPITIGADVWVGGGATICPGVTIGDRSVIAAGAIVTKDVPPDCLVAGNPARLRRHLEPPTGPSGPPAP